MPFPLSIMVNGLPGNVAATLLPHILQEDPFTLVPYSLTGPEVSQAHFTVGALSVELLPPDERDQRISPILKAHPNLIAVDYTHPLAVNSNAEFYARHRIPFVMGTTGGDRTVLESILTSSEICAVIAPNMAKQIVGFQAMIDFAANNFPDLFKGYSLRIEESHQKGKADTSGTAKAMVGYFNALGMDFSVEKIEMERNPERQKEVWGIPEEYIKGHAWHTYTLRSPDGTVLFQFRHNINGREIYVQGTLDAAKFLKKQMIKGCKGKIFSMMDVLRGETG